MRKFLKDYFLYVGYLIAARRGINFPLLAAPYEALREVWLRQVDTLRTLDWRRIQQELACSNLMQGSYFAGDTASRY